MTTQKIDEKVMRQIEIMDGFETSQDVLDRVKFIQTIKSQKDIKTF